MTEQGTLTLESIRAAMEAIGPPLPRVEIQICEGGAPYFTQAMGQALRARGSGLDTVEQSPLLGSHHSFAGIPVVESKAYPSGMGALVELDCGFPIPKFLIDWRGGKLEVFRI